MSTPGILVQVVRCEEVRFGGSQRLKREYINKNHETRHDERVSAFWCLLYGAGGGRVGQMAGQVAGKRKGRRKNRWANAAVNCKVLTHSYDTRDESLEGVSRRKTNKGVARKLPML